jgi:photosystem II stability/assembly factor-like uncharacterized protein
MQEAVQHEEAPSITIQQAKTQEGLGKMASNHPTSSAHDRQQRTRRTVTAWTLLVLSLILLASCASQTSTRVTTQQALTTPGKRMPTRTPRQAVTASPTTLANESIGSIQMIDTTTGWAVTAADHHILRTPDGGISWKEVTPPYARSTQAGDVVEDFLGAALAWVAIAPANGMPPTQVYRTTDGGQTWQVATVPTTSHLGRLTFLDPQHGWLLAGIQAAAGPKAVDVFRTTDGGTTWTKVSTASPTYTSPNALPPGAEWLAFADASTGWTTGSSPVSQFVWLYVTHDGGSTWHHQTLQPPAPVQGDLFTGPITFFNRQDGVLPTCFTAGADIYTDIYVTHDGGTTWNSTSLLPFSRCAVAAFGGASDFIDSTHG